MAPLLVQLVVTVLGRWFVASWHSAFRMGLVVMFLFTASSHFSSLRHEFAAMIPPPFTGALSLVYLTGLLQAAGAVGLILPGLRRWAAIGLALLLVAMFPANVYAALVSAQLGGAPVTSLWLRAPLQVWWIALLVAQARDTPANAASYSR